MQSRFLTLRYVKIVRNSSGVLEDAHNTSHGTCYGDGADGHCLGDSDDSKMRPMKRKRG